MSTSENARETDMPVKNPLATLLLGLQKMLRDRAAARVEADGGTAEEVEAAAAGSPWPEDLTFLAGVVDGATKEYLELSALRRDSGQVVPGVPSMMEALVGDKMRPLARVLSLLHQGQTAIEGLLGQPAELPAEIPKILWSEAFDEYMALILLSTPTEVVGQRRRYYQVKNLNDSDTMPRADDRMECAREEANVVGSLCLDGRHRPVLDIDHPCQLVPSSTPGHYHLYIDVPTSWEVYERLLWALSDAGVVSVFYARAAAQRRQSFVRVPWVRKETTERKAPGTEPPDAWQEREIEREARAMMARTKAGIDGLDWDRRVLAAALRLERERDDDASSEISGTG